MATKLYLQSGNTPVVSPTPDGGWTQQGNLIRYTTSTAKASTALTTRSVTTALSDQQDVLIGQWVSGPLDGGQSITASTGSLVILASETDAGNQLFVSWTVKVVRNNGTAVQDIIAKRNDATEVVATTLTSRVDTATMSTYTTVRGDRLVIEIGLEGNPSSTNTHNGSIRIGDAAAVDLGWADAQVADNNPAVQLNDTLTFNTDLYITKAETAITVADSAPKLTRVSNVNKAEAGIGTSDTPTVSVQATATRSINITEPGIGTADTPTVSVQATATPLINKAEVAISVADTPTISVSAPPVVDNNVNVSDTVASTTDEPTVSVQATTTRSINKSDSAGVSESIGAQCPSPISKSDTAPVTDIPTVSIQAATPRNANVGDSIGVSDSAPTIVNSVSSVTVADSAFVLEGVSPDDPFGVALQAKATSYWKLDELSSTRLDSVGDNDLLDGGGLNGVPVPSAEGKINNAASFVFAKDTTLYCPSNLSLVTGDVSFACTAWIWLDAKESYGYAILGKHDNLDIEWAIQYDPPEEGNEEADRFSWYMLGEDLSFPYISYPLTPNIGEWYFVAIWYDADLDLLGMSVNAGAVETFSWSGGTPQTTSAFGVGGILTSGGESVAGDFNGRLDEVLWIRGDVITQDEINYLYNGGSGRSLFSGVLDAIVSTSVISTSDSTTLDDSPTYYTEEIIVTESIAVSVQELSADESINVGDSTSLSEYISLAVSTADLNVSDSTSLSDTATVQFESTADLEVGVSDSTGTADAAIVALDDLLISATDNVGTSESTEASPYIIGPFPDNWDDVDVWQDENVRFIVPIGKIKAPAHNIRISLAYYNQTWSFSHLYIGHQAASGDLYDFDGNQVEVKFGGSSGGTVTSGGLISDATTFNLKNNKPLILSFFFTGEQQTPKLTTEIGYDLYYKFAADESGTTNVSSYSRADDYYLQRFLSFVTSTDGPQVVDVSDSTSLSESVSATVSDLNIDIAESSTVVLENGNRVTLENGDVVILAPSVRVGESVSLAVSAPQVSVSDSISTAESVSGQCPSPIAISNSVTVSESSDVRLDDLKIDIVEDSAIYVNGVPVDANGDPVIGGPFSVGVGESLAVYIEPMPVRAVDVSDTTSLTDTVISVVNSTCYGSVSDTIVVSEAIALDLGDRAIDVSDSTSISESYDVQIVAEVTVSDSTSVADTPALTLDDLAINVSSTIGTAEVIDVLETEAGVSYINVNDDVAVAPSVAVSLDDLAIAVSDSTSTTEDVTVALNDLEVSVSDSTELAETVTVTLDDLLVSVSDSTSVTDTPTVVLESATTLQVSVSDSVTISESVDVTTAETGAFSISVSDATSVSDLATLAVSAPQIAVTDGTTLSESYAVFPITAGTIVVSQTQSVTVSESVKATVSTSQIVVTDSVTVTDTPRVVATRQVEVSDSIALSELVQAVVSSPRVSVSEHVTLTEARTVRLDDLAVSVSDSTALADTATVFVVEAQLLTIAVSDTIAITEVLSLYNPLTGISVVDAMKLSEALHIAVGTIHLSKNFIMHINRGVVGDWQLGYSYAEQLRINRGVVLDEAIEQDVLFRLKIKQHIAKARKI